MEGIPQEKYDVIGDLHGCVPTLRALCDRLGYDRSYDHPGGRKLAFVGDIADRGPDNAGAFRLVMNLVESGRAWNILGNHDDGMLKHLKGEWDDVEGSIRRTVDEIDALQDSIEFRVRLINFLTATPLILWLDHGKLLLVHAGIEQAIIDQGAISEESRRFILNGDAIGKSPEGKTLRRDWAESYTGDTFIVYGHTPQETPLVRHNSANIDTGCYRGNALTALRWPEQEIVSQAAVTTDY